MKAIIVPGVTDLNKGDQALVWESHRLLEDTGLYEQIYILDSGDTEEERKNLCQQSIDKGFSLLSNILPHPRRGKHKNQEHIKESHYELAKQVRNAAIDLIKSSLLLTICSNLPLVKFLFSNKTYKTIKEFSEADAIFVKGGGFIHAYGEKTAPYLMWYFLFYIRLSQRFKKKVIFLPNSFGPFEGITVKSQIRSVLKNLDLIYAREEVSSKALGQLLHREIPVEMDLGFFLQKRNEEQAIEMLKKYNLSPSYKIIGITIRPWRFPGSKTPDELYDKYLNSIAALIDNIDPNEFKVALCNQSIGPNSHEDDRNAIQDLLLRIKNSNVTWINENLTCDQLKAVYSNFYFFIGTRFHSIIFSLTSFVPSIAIGYGGNKARGIMGDFNLNEYVIQIQDINPEVLEAKFIHALKNYLDIKNSLKQSIGSVNDSRNRIIKDIQSLYS